MKKALLISTLLFACCVGGNTPNGNNQQTESEPTESTSVTEPVKETKAKKEIETISSGFKMALTHSTGEVTFLFKEVNAKRLPNGSYNLILTIQIKHDTDETLWISEIEWKLTDADMIEVKESGMYEPFLKDFAGGTFFFTSVDSGFGAVEEVGYHVTSGTYYLCMLGKIMGKITL